MSSWIDRAVRRIAERRVGWRRARNLRSAPRVRPGPALWIAAAAGVSALGGAVLIAAHARQLAALAPAVHDDAAVFQALLPGATFDVPSAPGVSVVGQTGGALVVVSGMRAEEPAHIDLCTHAPIRIGYRFADVAKLPQAASVGLAGAQEMPRVRVSEAGGLLALRWEGLGARWVGDGGPAGLRRDGWLVWPGGALHLLRGRGGPCGDELTAWLFRPGASGSALVSAYDAHGGVASARLRPGRYQVPVQASGRAEDEALFTALKARAMVRLSSSGLIETVPRDLAAWRDAPESARASELAGWRAVVLDADARKLIDRLYRKADGEYVRTQIQVFNSERRLLGWRVRPARTGQWRASVGSAPAATASGLPASSSRLFADLPQAWAGWMRLASWPEAPAGTPARITLDLDSAGSVEIMLAGRLLGIEGAQLAGSRAVCDGRACPSADAVRVLALAPDAGARSVTLTALPLDMAGIGARGDEQYRHLRVRGGELAWHALAAGAGAARRQAAVPVTLVDRNGALLWSAGAPTRAATDAGLATLLGLHEQHAASVAGMLGRLQSAQAHQARLSIDLALQAASQAALDCIGMRHGRWDGRSCSGGEAVPPGRQAGLAIIDTVNGDVLAAAGAGGGSVTAANWEEVRDFDRANPARSPLRLPALQHDGGAHRSPGSTFKIVSALGLELAAQRDPQLDALLGGLPLASINRMARDKGFAFQTTAASYPVGTHLAHITNYKDQQLDRRAQDGRLGLAQALTYSLNTWFAWSGELSDASLFGRPDGGVPDLQPLAADALDGVRPIVAMAHRLGFEQAIRLDGGLLPPDYDWSAWDALQASPAHIDPVHTRHELRQMAIGLRMQTTPLQMALVAGAVGEGRTVAPRLLLALDGRDARPGATTALGVRLDRIRAGMKGVIDGGTAAGAFRAPALDAVRHGLFGKTGTSPTSDTLSTVWFTGWLEPGSLPGQTHRLAIAAFVSHSATTGGEHAAPIAAALLREMSRPKPEQTGK